MDTRRDDRAVSEIIGTILVIAIAVSVATSVLAWYLPTQAASNDYRYQGALVQSFLSMDSGVAGGGLVEGEQLSFPVAQGIAGIPPFSGPEPTSISILNSSPVESVSLSILVDFTYLSNSTSSHAYLNLSIAGSGSLASGYYTDGAQPLFVYLEDTSVVLDYIGGSVYCRGVSPVSASSSNLSVSMISYVGRDTAYSSDTESDVVMTVENTTQLSLESGSITTIDGTAVEIGRIDMLSLNYTITSPAASALNSMMQQYFNSTAFQDSSASWHLGALATVTLSGDTIHIEGISGSLLKGLQFRASTLYVVSL
ncbi:hypothetical protein [Thermogymnomonas acidicola]|uniref:archaellin/type IV pilin N-terminal domain-containing protein n=1 Tax=Thermogymnomonas acidicola TaxID=399579 RepID=UPI000946781C|nr:archaellin/type IV pilin N-terminal domain-containing protein [Thermogymnomonas acidicola]